MDRPKIRSALLMLCSFFELLVGAMLLVSVAIHVSSPYLFLETAIRYQILTPAVLTWILPALVGVQFGLACCLLTRTNRCNSLYASSLLFLIFLGAQISVLSRGILTDCGCFGSVSETVGVLSALKLAGLTLLCLLLARINK
jgi:hypothetical protein